MGRENVAIGYASMYRNRSGGENVGIGNYALGVSAMAPEMSGSGGAP